MARVVCCRVVGLADRCFFKVGATQKLERLVMFGSRRQPLSLLEGLYLWSPFIAFQIDTMGLTPIGSRS